jgi:MFS family permease
LVNIFYINVLDATEMWFAIFALTSGMSALASGTFWQRLLQKRGNNTTFIVAAALLASNMFFFPFIPNVWVMSVVTIFIGFSAIGINTALLNGVLEATPDENRMVYLATYNTIINISLFISPFFAFALLSAAGIVWAFVIIGVLRFVATGILWLTAPARSVEE